MTAIKEQDQPQAHAGDVCKNCGYCPHCGQSRQQAVPWYPYGPYVPIPSPIRPWVPSSWIVAPQITWSTGGNSVSISTTGSTADATQFTLT